MIELHGDLLEPVLLRKFCKVELNFLKLSVASFVEKDQSLSRRSTKSNTQSIHCSNALGSTTLWRRHKIPETGYSN